MADVTIKDALSKRRADGRRIAMTLYYVVVALVGGAAAVQISQQVLFPAVSRTSPTATCQDEFRGLFAAIGRAREAAASENGGEDAALDRFRAALNPTWASYERIQTSCRGTADGAGTLDAIERLRYAEEHAVRREAGELAPLRRKVQAIVDQLGR